MRTIEYLSSTFIFNFYGFRAGFLDFYRKYDFMLGPTRTPIQDVADVTYIASVQSFCHEHSSQLKKLTGVIQITQYYNEDMDTWRHLDDINNFLVFIK